MTWDAARLANRLRQRHLVLLENIARHGTLTRVAAATGISQPAATKALAELEAIFGAPLFLRTGRGMQPTPLGELALVRARRMQSDLTCGRARSKRCTMAGPPTCTWAWCRMYRVRC